MNDPTNPKTLARRELRSRLAGMTDEARHRKSVVIGSLVCSSAEWRAAGVVMLYLSTPQEVDTAPIAIRAWQEGKTVVVPKVSWDQRRMLPVEITSLSNDLMTTTGQGIREPLTGKPVPAGLIDLVLVPGMGFTENGHRIGRGMGFYDRFLAQPGFFGVSCGVAFSEQIMPSLPMLDHDVPLSMLVTDAGILRFTTNCIERR
jgi:5-formyltetrahydrofolate cyclo-ligase